MTLPQPGPLQKEGARSRAQFHGLGSPTPQKPSRGARWERAVSAQKHAEQEREAQRRKGTKVSPAGREEIRLWVEGEKADVSQRQ